MPRTREIEEIEAINKLTTESENAILAKRLAAIKVAKEKSTDFGLKELLYWMETLIPLGVHPNQVTAAITKYWIAQSQGETN